MAARNGSHLVYVVLGGLLGALLSGAGVWVTWGRSVVDEPKVIELIETRSPYVLDKRLLLDNGVKLKELEQAVRSLELEVRELKTLLHVMIEDETGPRRNNGAF